MLIINSIDKSRLSADNFSYSGDGVAWKARVVLFMGFAAMAGGLAGGVTVMVLKYVVPNASWPAFGFGLVGSVMLRIEDVSADECAVERDSECACDAELDCALGEVSLGCNLLSLR